MLIGPDWNKLYANGQCLYFGVPFTDDQWNQLNAAKSQADKDVLIRKWREEYLKTIDQATGNKKAEEKAENVEKKPVEETTEGTIEESIEDVNPTKKKGK